LLREIIPDRIGHGTCLQPDAGGTKDIVGFVESHRIPLGNEFIKKREEIQ
jgi:hypothetical protein